MKRPSGIVTQIVGAGGSSRTTGDATGDTPLNRSEAHLLVEMNEAEFMKEAGLYRERVDVEIGKGSEHAARWWSRRLIQLYEDAGWVRLDDSSAPALERSLSH